MPIEKLTDTDRANILALADIYDRMVSSKPLKPKKKFIYFNKDVETLLNYGFSYGPFRAAMYNTDKDGVEWQVTDVMTRPSHNGGWFSETAWYRILPSGLRERWYGRMTEEELSERFR